MPEREVGQAAQSSTLDILAKLEKRRVGAMALIDQLDEPNTAIRCDAQRGLFDDLYQSIRLNVAPLEQEKGIAKGLQLAAGVLGTHADLWRSELDEIEHGPSLELILRVIKRGVESIKGAELVQRKTLERNAGKFDGAVNSAMSTLQQIEKFADHFERSKTKQAEIEQTSTAVDEVDQALEQQAEKRAAKAAGGNNVPEQKPEPEQQAAPVVPISSAKKAPAKKKSPTRRRKTKRTTKKTK